MKRYRLTKKEILMDLIDQDILISEEGVNPFDSDLNSIGINDPMGRVKCTSDKELAKRLLEDIKDD